MSLCEFLNSRKNETLAGFYIEFYNLWFSLFLLERDMNLPPSIRYNFIIIFIQMKMFLPGVDMLIYFGGMADNGKEKNTSFGVTLSKISPRSGSG